MEIEDITNTIETKHDENQTIQKIFEIKTIKRNNYKFLFQSDNERISELIRFANDNYNISFKKFYKYYNGVFKSIFISKLEKQEFQALIYKNIRFKHFIIDRIIQFKNKIKNPKLMNEFDLFGKPITDQCIFVEKNNCKWGFTEKEVNQLIKTAIYKYDNFYSQPEIAKNPYNNEQFTYNELIGLYNKLEKPCLEFQILRSCNFNIKLLTEIHWSMLSNKAYINTVKHCDEIDFMNWMEDLFIEMDDCNHLFCKKFLYNSSNFTFVKQTFTKAMIYFQKYCNISDETYEIYRQKLYNELHNIHENNFNVRRKIYRVKRKKTKK